MGQLYVCAILAAEKIICTLCCLKVSNIKYLKPLGHHTVTFSSIYIVIYSYSTNRNVHLHHNVHQAVIQDMAKVHQADTVHAQALSSPPQIQG
jgi:hypothetical protein